MEGGNKKFKHQKSYVWVLSTWCHYSLVINNENEQLKKKKHVICIHVNLNNIFKLNQA